MVPSHTPLVTGALGLDTNSFGSSKLVVPTSMFDPNAT